MILADIPANNYVRADQKRLSEALPAPALITVIVVSRTSPETKAQVRLVAWTRGGTQIYLMPDGYLGTLPGWIPQSAVIEENQSVVV